MVKLRSQMLTGGVILARRLNCRTSSEQLAIPDAVARPAPPGCQAQAMSMPMGPMGPGWRR